MPSAVSTLKARSFGFSLKAVLCRFIQKFVARPLFGWQFRRRGPARLLYTPLDLHLADPKLAHEFYHGRFPFDGRVVQAGSVSPFFIEPPNEKWENALQSFSWLNHMAAAETELADAHARALTFDWLEETGRKPVGPAWIAGIAARRLSAWLAHADILCNNATRSFQKQLLKSIGLHIRYLRLAFAGEKDNADRLVIAAVLLMAELAVPLAHSARRNNRTANKARRRLEAELARQILPDGGHISRNPALLLELLLYLIPLQYAYLDCGFGVPPILMSAIDRMLPALRFFRHRDGTLANFNGVGPILAQRLAIVLNADKTKEIPFSHAPYSGYQRLVGGKTIIIADTGRSFSKNLTSTANAGCLSFEMSSGLQRFIINCGIDPFGSAEFRFFGRLTAAHSTATIEDTSSCCFADSADPETYFAALMPEVQVKRIDEEDRQGFIAVHDGYKKAFNLTHERALTLNREGTVLQGCDSFYPANDKKGLFGKTAAEEEAVQIAVRFHLHPDIRPLHEGVEEDQETGAERDIVRLSGPNGESWLFAADGPVRLEDSIYFSALSGPQKTRQLVLNFSTDEVDKIYWEMRRDDGA